MPICLPAPVDYPLFCTLVSGSTHSQTEILRSNDKICGIIIASGDLNKSLLHFFFPTESICIYTPGPQKKMSSKLYLRPRVKNTYSPSIGSRNRTGRRDLFTMATYRCEERALMSKWCQVLRCRVIKPTAYHIVLKAEDAVVNIKLSQFFLMDADLVLLLDLNYSGLNLLPCGIRKFWLE